MGPTRLLTRAGLAALLLCALGAAPVRAQEHPDQYPAADVAAGGRVYYAMCVACHAASGAGVGGVDLRHGPLPRASTDAALRAVVTTGFPVSGMPAFPLSADELRGIVAFVRAGWDAGVDVPVTPGDPGRGRIAFEQAGRCLECHRVGDAGGHAGPDLTEIGRTLAAAAIQRSLLDPNGSMRPINRPVRAVTRDGRVVKGRRLNEDTYTVQLLDDSGRLVSFVKADLREWSVTTTSPMPSYRDTLAPGALADIVAYVASLKGSQP